ncbi:MAG: DMT family transporter [Paracoccus sp. (in: a-proteobacteria)]|uniref:DMT family transporter n=1 Tax=Paracoccus sp. TaxID=267 RepID=UPI0026E09B82|nr:DMT family transporter [Paracoccus sp. (in: a-proteobacteria)]MDO5620606.1 DMT family transporter [Paracoccus sp. (in: a-proteobacteria)]
MLWIAATLIAAAAQTGRNAAQSGLVTRLGTMGATGVRFLFGLPFALLFLALVGLTMPLPRLTGLSLGFAALGALAQMAATAIMLVAMRQKGFAVATALIKTEPVILALAGALILSEPLGAGRMAAICLATLGVLVTSGLDLLRSTLVPVATAIFAGGLFGLSAIGFRGAILALPDGHFIARATLILSISLAFQAALTAVWLMLTDRAALRGIIAAWRESLGAGFLGALASQSWFVGFALTSAANVRTLALIEVVFAWIISGRMFHQRISPQQLAGMGLIVVGVGWLLLLA